jgi:hypothetical protein
MSELMTYDDALPEIAETLGNFFEAEPHKAVLWMMTPNPMLGNVVPAWLMLSYPNGPYKLWALVRNLREGNLP